MGGRLSLSSFQMRSARRRCPTRAESFKPPQLSVRIISRAFEAKGLGAKSRNFAAPNRGLGLQKAGQAGVSMQGPTCCGSEALDAVLHPGANRGFSMGATPFPGDGNCLGVCPRNAKTGFDAQHTALPEASYVQDVECLRPKNDYSDRLLAGSGWRALATGRLRLRSQCPNSSKPDQNQTKPDQGIGIGFSWIPLDFFVRFGTFQ